MIMKTGVYGILNVITNKYYVGSSVNILSRIKRHFSDLRRGKHHSIKLQRSWNIHGESAFSIVIIEETRAKKEILLEREQYWIDCLSAYSNGYNSYATAGSPLGGKRTAEQIAMVSGKNSKLYGIKKPKEWIEKISGENNYMFGLKGKDHPSYGRKHTDEELLRMSGENHPRYGLKGEKCPIFGRKQSEDHVKKRIEASMNTKKRNIELGIKSPLTGENNPMFGKSGELHPGFGRKHTEEELIKMRGENNPMFGKKGPDHPAYGWKDSEETRLKKSEAKKKYWEEKRLAKAKQEEVALGQ